MWGCRNPASWSLFLPWVEYAHNSLASAATGILPFMTSLGYQPLFFELHEYEVATPSVWTNRRLSRIRPVTGSDLVPLSEPLPLPRVIHGSPAYTVQHILDARRHRHDLQFLVDWAGYSPEERTWIPRCSILHNSSPALFLQGPSWYWEDIVRVLGVCFGFPGVFFHVPALPPGGVVEPLSHKLALVTATSAVNYL